MSLSLNEVIKRANIEGVGYMLTISTEDKSFKNILKIISEHDCVFGTYEFIHTKLKIIYL